MRSWPAGSPPRSRRCPAEPEVAAVVVVGDVATDVVVVLAGDPAPGSDRPASIRTRGGGAGANVAVHLAQLGTPVLLAGCVGDDPAGAAPTAEPGAARGPLSGGPGPGAARGTTVGPGRAGARRRP